MAKKTLIKSVLAVNEGQIIETDVLISNGRIDRIDRDITFREADIVDAKGCYLIPGCIDDQVHFREPGLTHKADIYFESRAAAAGGITSFMEMPNTNPLTLTRELLEAKYEMAKQRSLVNYSFYMGASNENLDQVLKIDYKNVCGIKVFMGSSTGNMLVDNPSTLEKLFSEAEVLIATHCEDETTIRKNLEEARQTYGDDIPVRLHPVIRSREACLLSSRLAISLARKHNTRLHILHISTAEETDLFRNDIPLSEKRITAEACVHHLFFNDEQYEHLAAQIKCNPAIKTANDGAQIAQALKDGRIDVVATDHAPHLMEEKLQMYSQSPSGLPLVQHSLLMMVTMAEKYNWELPFIVQKMAHDVATCFNIQDRGYLREGYFADLVLLTDKGETAVQKSNLLYKCKWSPLEGQQLKGKIVATFVNGHCVYSNNQINEVPAAQRLNFRRK